MKKPILVVMAAGMGSRYGGLKQIDPVGSHGEVIMDYSLYDARRAGFEKVIFIIFIGWNKPNSNTVKPYQALSLKGLRQQETSCPLPWLCDSQRYDSAPTSSCICGL